MLDTYPASPGNSFTIPDQLYVDALSFEEDLLTLSGCLRGSEAHCPVCGESSRRVHSRYTRTLADLPWAGTPVCLRVRVRKFFCDEPSCELRIFAERLHEVASVYARSTDRQKEALEWIAFALGGEAGARLARELGLIVSPDTLLNRIRGALCAESADVRVLGVDDFVFRKASNYGTVLVDLERHKVVDLLPDRSSKTLADWLRQHPNLKTLSRDRSPTYAEGIAEGAPQAIQVADRWHLMRNLAETLDEFLIGKRPLLKAAARPETEPKPETEETPISKESTELPYEDEAAPGPLSTAVQSVRYLLLA